MNDQLPLLWDKMSQTFIAYMKIAGADIKNFGSLVGQAFAEGHWSWIDIPLCL